MDMMETAAPIGARSEQVRRLRQLMKHGSARRSASAFLAEGPRALADLASAGVPLRCVYADERFDIPPSLTEAADRVQLVRPGVLARVSDVSDGAHLIGEFELTLTPPDRMALDRPVLLLDGVQVPANVGALLRVAVAHGFGGVVCGPGSADPFSPKSVRGSAGLLGQIAVCGVDDLAATIRALGSAGRTTWVAARGGETVWGVAFEPNYALVVGSEGRGVSDAVRAEAARSVSIPMEPGVESLNVATAAAIIAAVAYHRLSAPESPLAL